MLKTYFSLVLLAVSIAACAQPSKQKKLKEMMAKINSTN